MARMGWTRWLSKRFVVLSEIIGYTLSAAIGLGVLYSVFVEVEVVARVKGELRPSCTEIKAESDTLFVEYLAASHGNVRKGQPVLRVVTDAAARRRILVRRQLEATVAALASDPTGESRAALEDTRRALATLPPVEGKTETLTAPCDGVFQQMPDMGKDGVIPAGKALALVYTMSELLLDASPEASAMDSRIADGQEARMTIPGTQERLAGRVILADGAAASKGVTIQYDDVPETVRGRVSTLWFGKDREALKTVEAEVVVGHQSLFRKTFGRRQ